MKWHLWWRMATIDIRRRYRRTIFGQFWTTPGFCDELMYVFVATGLEPSKLEPDEDEDISVVRVAVSRIRGMMNYCPVDGEGLWPISLG